MLHNLRWVCLPVILLSVLVLSISSAIGQSSEEKSTERKRVEELIRDLNSPTLVDRSRAERQLLELGTRTLKFLPPLDLIESPAARDAVRRLRLQLERLAARESANASTVSLAGELSLAVILAEITRQTGNQIRSDDLPDEILAKRIQTSWKNLSFWDCVDELSRREKVRWKYGDHDKIQFTIQNSGLHEKLPSARNSGPFHVELESTEVRPIVGNDEQSLLRINGSIAIEPRLRPLFLSLIAKEFNVTTDLEQSLSVWNPDAKYELPLEGRQTKFQLDFVLPTELKATTISLRGRANCQIVSATEPVVFDQKSLVRGTIRRRGGVTIRLRNIASESVHPDRINGEIGIVVSYETGGPAFESHRSWIFHNQTYLETSNGKRIQYTGFDLAQQTDGAVAVEYLWNDIEPPFDQYQFVYEAPTLILNVPIDFDFRKIALQQSVEK